MDPGVGSAAILEATHYRFAVELAGDSPIHLEPAELFDPDVDQAPDGRARVMRGRLSTGNHVGSLDIVVEASSGERLTGLVDIRSTKLDFDSQYRWMVSGIAEEGAALLLRSFGPAGIDLVPDITADADTAYQQLVFLSAILRRPHTQESVERVLRSPHVSYRDQATTHPVGRGIPGSSMAVKAVTRPGPRVPAPTRLLAGSVPEVITAGRSEATIDNAPNQFVRWVLEYWAAVLDRVDLWLTGQDTQASARGRREVRDLIDRVEQWRTDRRLRDVGPLTDLPRGNQVILRRPGYREIHQVFLESRAAAMLRWDGAQEVSRGGQRDIAQLYEYWCYLELRRLVEELCDHSDAQNLFETTDEGMHLVLRRGRQRVVSGYLIRGGRMIDVELWFNRSFSTPAESWSLQLRPDCSLRFLAQTRDGQRIETWVHFDAKYRIASSNELFIDDDEPQAARREDLLKMHAYRDSIRWSAGAYVLFPGSEPRCAEQHAEVLPGLGAFAFVPGSDGHATSATTRELSRFLDEVMDHIATQASNREREAYWSRQAHEPEPVRQVGPFVPLNRPPADTTVLLGYYRSAQHLDWIERTGLYNLRLDGRRGAVSLQGAEAAAELLVLWSAGEAPVKMWWLEPELQVLDAEEMTDREYPNEPTGRYLCRVLGQPVADAPDLSSDAIRNLADRSSEFGRPVATTFDRVLAHAAEISLATQEGPR